MRKHSETADLKFPAFSTVLGLGSFLELSFTILREKCSDVVRIATRQIANLIGDGFLDSLA